MTNAQIKLSTADEYLRECIHMLNRQPDDWHIGAAERNIIAGCWRFNRPVTTAVAFIMHSVDTRLADCNIS